MVAVLTDTLARSVTDGWGTPDVGPAYTLRSGTVPEPRGTLGAV